MLLDCDSGDLTKRPVISFLDLEAGPFTAGLLALVLD